MSPALLENERRERQTASGPSRRPTMETQRNRPNRVNPLDTVSQYQAGIGNAAMGRALGEEPTAMPLADMLRQRSSGTAGPSSAAGPVPIAEPSPSAAEVVIPKPQRAVEPPSGKAEAATALEAHAEEKATVSASAGEGRADVELLMPEPPSELSPEAQGRLSRSQRNLSRNAETEATLPVGETSVANARGAVEEPIEETAGRAQDALVAALGERPAPSPEIEELCQRIYGIIRAKRPPDEDSLVEAEPDQMAQEAGGELNQSIEGDIGRVRDDYAPINHPEPGEPQLHPEEFESPSESVERSPVNAAAAAPDPVPEESVSLDADVQAAGERMQAAGMESEPAQLVRSGPIAEAREAQGELGQMAERDPAELLAEQEAALTAARTDMAELQQTALAALRSSRRNTIRGDSEQQNRMVESEQQTRTRISTEASAIFDSSQQLVNSMLQPLVPTAMARWDSGVAVLSQQFKTKLRRVESWIEERHEGVGGAFVSAWDWATGLPDWVTDEYDAAEQSFGDGVCALVREISTYVNGIVAACEAIIDDARERISALFTGMPTGLDEWAAGELAKFNERLDGLQHQVTETRDNFTNDLANRAAQSVQEVREQIHSLREAAKGIVGRIADAIERFVEDPWKFIIEGLLELVGIPPASFWAVVNKIKQAISDIADDPLGFANNLLEALAQGFQKFFDNFVDHLLGGFLDWLFSGLGAVGVQLPSDFSIKSIITFFLQLMGITWERIRALLVKHIGEENVALIEKAFELVSSLIELGPSGIFELLKDRLDPNQILDQVMDAAIDFLVEALIKNVSARIIALFNPAGAVVQAIEAIYRVLKWIFENAARIFSLIETVVNGITNIIAGNIGGMASAVEQALAGLIAPVVDFLAGYAGLGDLPDKIADTIRGFQDWVEGILDRIIGWLAEKGRALLQAVGLGGEEPGTESAEGEYDGQLGKVVSFTAAGEQHRLWIVSQDGRAAVMVASEKQTVPVFLTEFERRAAEIEDEEKRSRVSGLLQSARKLYSDLDARADALAAHVGEPEGDVTKITSEDAQVESLEEQLASSIRAIQEELGVAVDPAEVDSPVNPGDELIVNFGGWKRGTVIGILSGEEIRQPASEDYFVTVNLAAGTHYINVNRVRSDLESDNPSVCRRPGVITAEFRSLLLHPLLHPGKNPHAFLPASGPDVQESDRVSIQPIGEQYGCHHNGTKRPHERWIPDHQPPSALIEHGLMSGPQRLYPHSPEKSQEQGGVVAGIIRKWLGE